MYISFLCGLVTLGMRLYWLMHAGVPPVDTPTVWDAYFPELRLSGVTAADLRRSDGHFDVLLLGASVLAPQFGTIDQQLRELLGARLGERGRVWNLAVSGQTSRDSLIKYRRLSDKHFDLVLIYDAINDVRMNNCRPGEFREDYSHSRRYEGFERHLRQGSAEFADMLHQAELFNDLLAGGSMSNLREFGRDIKTPPAYRRNIEEIMELARKRVGRIALLSFASHIPADYTRADFDAHRVDYSYRDDGHSCAVELWGDPDPVRKTLAAHNQDLREIAMRHPEALFVDM